MATIPKVSRKGKILYATISDWFCWAFVPRKCLEEKQSNASREGANSKRRGSFVIVLSAQVTSGKRAKKIQWCWLTSLFRPHIAFSVWNRMDDSYSYRTWVSYCCVVINQPCECEHPIEYLFLIRGQLCNTDTTQVQSPYDLIRRR